MLERKSEILCVARLSQAVLACATRRQVLQLHGDGAGRLHPRVIRYQLGVLVRDRQFRCVLGIEPRDARDSDHGVAAIKQRLIAT